MTHLNTKKETSASPSRKVDIEAGIAEIKAIVEAYKGPLIMDAARHFYEAKPGSNAEFVTIIFPPEALTKYGLDGFCFSNAEIYETELASCEGDPRWRQVYQELLRRHPHPARRPKAHSLRRADLQVRWAMAEMPEMPSKNAKAFLADLEDSHKGFDIALGIIMPIPDDIAVLAGFGSDLNEGLTKDYAMHCVVPFLKGVSPERMASLRAIAEDYFPDESIEVEIAAPGDEFTIWHPTWEGEDSRELALSGRRVPGSVRLAPFTDTSAYSPDDKEFEYSLYYVDEADEDGSDAYFLVSDKHVLTVEF